MTALSDAVTMLASMPTPQIASVGLTEDAAAEQGVAGDLTSPLGNSARFRQQYYKDRFTCVATSLCWTESVEAEDRGDPGQHTVGSQAGSDDGVLRVRTTDGSDAQVSRALLRLAQEMSLGV